MASHVEVRAGSDHQPGRFSAGSRRATPWALALPSLLIAAAVNVPLAYVFLRAFDSGWAVWLVRIASARTLDLLFGTLLLVAGVVAVTVAIAVPLGWLVARTDLHGRRVWGVLVALPLVLPSYVAAFALVAIAGPRGVLQDWLQPFGIDRLPPIALGYSGALLALALFTYPYIYLMVVSALRGIDPALEESSRTLGVGRAATFLRVTLPQLRPAIYGGSLLVALYAVSDFGAVSITRYDTLTLGVFHAYTALFDRGVAAASASVLAMTALVLIAGQSLALRRIRPAPATPSRPPTIVPLGRLQWPCQFAIGLLVAVTVVGPVGVILAWGVRGLSDGAAAVVPAIDSVLVSALAAIVAAALSIPVAAWALRHRTTPARLTERLCYSGYALPGLVIALALVFLATRSIGWAYQTLGLLIAGYVIRFLPEAISATRSAMSEVPPILEDAGRSLGESSFGVLRTVTLPLIRPGLLAGGGLVFLTAMKELPATLILRPAGFETLATRIWSSASEGVYAAAAVPSLLLVLLSAAPVYLLIVRPALGRRET